MDPKDIQGDLHMHSNWSDGAHSIEELVAITKKLGYDLFSASGIKPTSRERILALFEKEAVKTIFMITGGIALTGLLIWLGIQCP